ncbi:hypothetical protein [Pinisolibacter sp.]|uniref:hypothetical protein n=1 Tax=Pinisolibacter sp. TaxID=2172024 RepID=UPI002FDE7E9B
MSTISRAHRIQLTIAAASLAVALVGGIASAFAQTAGGGNGGPAGGSSPGNGSSGSSAVLVYGLPGNCPPTIACGPGRPHRPLPVRVKRYDPCGDFQPGSRLYNQCRKEL